MSTIPASVDATPIWESGRSASQLSNVMALPNADFLSFNSPIIGDMKKALLFTMVALMTTGAFAQPYHHHHRHHHHHPRAVVTR